MNPKTSFAAIAVIFSTLIVTTLYAKQNQQYTITVTSGAFDREESVVSFTFPDVVEPGTYRLESETGGEPIPLQVDDHNTGWFILDHLPAGSTITYSLDPDISASTTSGGSGVSKTVNHNTITLTTGDNGEVLSYYYRENSLPEELDEMYRRGGYIHPVYSPDGIPLTNHLDQNLHPHHYGIFSAWTSTEFQGRTPDFWNPHQHTGRVDHADSLDYTWEGPVHGGFQAKNYFVDISSSAPVVALNEEWKVIVYNTLEEGAYRMFDIVLTQTANTAQPLVLPQYHYGGMAFRGHADWDQPENVTFLTSEGYDRTNGNETRARWSHMGGIVDGKRAGIAVLSHPDNYRSPQPVRIHPETPYFVYSPMQLGRMSIEPGSPYVMRYRYITYDGEPDPSELDRLWNDYAYPPGVSVIAK